MRRISDMPETIAAEITTVFADIDDTLTTGGRLPGKAYSALEALYNAGLHVAPITGRPAGWCDMIARFWPVHGVVGENGALYFAYDTSTHTMKRVYAASDAARQSNQLKYQRIRDRILREVPGAAVSADQRYREADLAIDFCEDVPALRDTDIDRIKSIFEDEGAVAKISSIHVNGWFGSYDKLSMTRRFSSDILDLDVDTDHSSVVFCGDSPNDAPMFAHFPNACGVANVLDFRDRMEASPAWIASQRGGEGFAEIAGVILAAKANKNRRLSA